MYATHRLRACARIVILCSVDRAATGLPTVP